MSIVAVITARGGSKRIPEKNIKLFKGKPIIAYTIEAALKCRVFDEVMVSTDSVKIAELSQKLGAQVPFLRSNETSDDYATTSDVLEEVLAEYNKIGKKFDNICCIYPTAPFVTPVKLQKAMELFIQKEANCVISVTKYSFPPQRSFVVRDEEVFFQFKEYEKTRSQDLEPVYHDCGQFYFLKTSALLKYHSLVPPQTYPYYISELETQDIDNISDWYIAEAKYDIIQHNVSHSIKSI